MTHIRVSEELCQVYPFCVENEFLLSPLVGAFIEQAPCDALHLVDHRAARQGRQQRGEVEVHLGQWQCQGNLMGKRKTPHCKEA